MTFSPIDTDSLFDAASLSLEGIQLTSEQVNEAIALSELIPDHQWQTYLNALALFGFEQWLQEKGLTATSDRAFLSRSDLGATVCNVQVGAFKVCLLTIGNLSDSQLDIPAIVLDAADLAAHLYVVMEVQEEQEQVQIKACLRSDQLMQHQTEMIADGDRTYTLPLSWFEGTESELLLYLRCLEPTALPLAAATPEVAPLAEPTVASQPVLTNLVQGAINTGLWLRDQLDTAAQELAWILLPPPVAPAFRSSTVLDASSATSQFEQLVTELRRTGIEVPQEARGAYRNLQWGTIALRLYAMTWALPTDGLPEWTLLLALGAQPGSRLPLCAKLRVQDETQILLERSVTEATQESYLYTRVIGSWKERFWVTIDLSNGAVVTLPPFSFDPNAA